MRVLVSAYACEPGVGSEPGVGWKTAREAARHHEVWVLTRANNRAPIQRELAREPVPGLRFAYFDLPAWARWWKRGQRGIQLYYYLWQVGAYFAARRLMRKTAFGLAHHVTFVKYWSPSFLALLPLPFVWGPVGGGESAPRAFRQDFGRRGRAYEALRDLARRVGESDPFVRLCAQRSSLALATTGETADRLVRLGARDVRLFSQLGVSREELEEFDRHATGGVLPVRFVSVGRLLHWKGFHLGLRAFARAGVPDAEYWVIGSGPERERLGALAERLGVASRVTFLGDLPREEVFRRLAGCRALVHPSLHDSGGMVCLEAMGMGRPVICLDLGGPAVQVTEATGFKVPVGGPEEAVEGLAAAMAMLARSPDLALQMGAAARRRVEEEFAWEEKGRRLAGLYAEAAGRGGRGL